MQIKKIIIALALLPNLVFGAITFDNKIQGNAGASPSAQTTSYTNAGDILYVSVFSYDSSNDPCNTITSATYNSVSMTAVNSRSNGSNECAKLFRLQSPAVGTYDITVNYSGSDYGVWVASSFNGTETGTNNFVSTTNAGNPNATTTATTSSSDNWCVSAVGAGGSAPTASASSYLRQVGSNVAITTFDTNGAVSGVVDMAYLSNSNLYAVMECFEPLGGGGGSATTTEYNATTTAILGSIAYGLAIIITILSIALVAYLFNTISKRKKPWQ